MFPFKRPLRSIQGSGKKLRTELAAMLRQISLMAWRHGIDPFVYLRDLLTRISTHHQSLIYELFPDNWLKLRQEAAAPAEASST